MTNAVLMLLLCSTPTEGFVVTNKCKPAAVTVTSRVATTTTTYRQPRGHTHTCANGHTWDHDANPTHTCRVCGLSQFVVDGGPRMVTVVGPAPTASSSYQLIPLSPGTGGCATGNCPLPQQTGRRR